MRDYHIDHPHNEASALVAIHNRALLDAQEWDVAFWIASDEKPTRKAIAALGRDRNGEWQVRPLKTTLSADSDSKTAEDCETLARAGGWIYIFGSQYGSKEGPLQPKRHFVARFNESLVETQDGTLRATLDLARSPFLLHRLINDALRESGVKLIERGEQQKTEMIDATVEAGQKKTWGPLIDGDDHPVNVEGSTFLPDGRLLLGLRYPVTHDGHPILAEIDGIDRIFHKEQPDPQVTSLWILTNVGSKRAPAGVRELDHRGQIHVVTGGIDSDPEASVILKDAPHGDRAVNRHHAFDPPTDHSPVVKIEATEVRRFDGNANVEGLAVQDDGTVWYVHDDERIRLQRAEL
ncbi:MAG TPA: DUF3616 domain-containing protein [Thermoanaerobaculia bacterium]